VRAAPPWRRPRARAADAGAAASVASAGPPAAARSPAAAAPTSVPGTWPGPAA
jgi:hypothetical protein